MNESHSDSHWRKKYQEQFRVFFLCSIVKSRIFRKLGTGLQGWDWLSKTKLVPLGNFSPILDPNGYWAVSHLLRYGASVYIGHLWGPVTFTPVAERLALELSLPFLQLRSVAAWIRTLNLSLAQGTL